MQIKLWTASNSVTLTQAEPKYGHDLLYEEDEPIEKTNTAINGTPYHYYDASKNGIEIDLDWLTETQKTDLQAMRAEGTDISFQIDSETVKTVRIIDTMRFTRTKVGGDWVYNTTVRLLIV